MQLTRRSRRNVWQRAATSPVVRVATFSFMLSLGAHGRAAHKSRAGSEATPAQPHRFELQLQAEILKENLHQRPPEREAKAT